MRIKKYIKKVLDVFFFNKKWRCNVCGKEIFDGDYFCEKCKNELPYNDGVICQHCGRKVESPTDYCLTCKGVLTNVDKSRSAFVYKKPINQMIAKAKYFGRKYYLDIFAEYLANVYFKNYFNADIIAFVPMTQNARKKRGYNQAQILAERVSEIINLPVLYGVSKKKETERQVTLNKAQRLKNLTEAYKITDKKSIKDKSVLIVDDVTTTGATAEALAGKLKKAGAKEVFLLTVASVPAIK